MQNVRQELHQRVDGVVRVAGIGANDWILWVEVQRFADVLDAMLGRTVELVETNNERNAPLLEEIDRVEALIEATGVYRQSQSPRRFAQ